MTDPWSATAGVAASGSPASAAQYGMWLNEQLGIAGTAYEMALPVYFDGPLDRPALERAMVAVRDRHPILTSSFREVDGTLRVEPGGGSLFRHTLTQLAPQRHLLLIEAHHLVFDGTSKDILLCDLALAYAGQPIPPLDPEPDPDEGEEAAAREYWRTRWAESEEPVLPGLTGYERTGQPGATFDFTLSGFDEPGYTRFEVLFAALQGLLLRYGNPCPVIAVDLGTRKTSGAIGLYVNELPVRMELDERDLRGRARAHLRELYRHRRIPLSSAVKLSPRLALAPISISYRKRAPLPTFAGLVTTVDWQAFHGTARNALHIQMVDDGTSVDVRFHYNPQLLAVSYVEQIATGYRQVVAGIPLAEVGEPSRLDGPAVPAEGSQRVHELIDGQPGAIAIVGDGLSLTYAELASEADAVAQRLRALGVGPGDRVAVRLRRTPRLLSSLLGVWQTGAAYVPIDPDYPGARQALLLSDSTPAALITEDGIVALSGGPASDAGLAYVIYTSGSTGRPKGVEVEHGSVVNLLHAMRSRFGAGRWLALASYAFDMSVPELWLPLTTGGAVVLASEEQARDAEQLLKLIRTQGVTHVHVTPSTWQRLLEAGFDEPGVVAIAGAEPLPVPVAAQLRRRCAELWNLYGPTETTVWSTAARIDGDVVTLGGPLANTQLHVLDGSLRHVPVGVPGELCIGGRGVGRGYHGLASLTNERFVHTRFGRLYRTGDRVRVLAGGIVEWIGRFDNQIKLRGYRIELGEIEARLLEHPAIRAAAVIANPELSAYVVGPAEGLKEHLVQVLPAYMVPAHYVSLAQLPLTPNGKLDRSALPVPPPSIVDSTRYEGVAQQVFEVWAEVLGRQDIGPDDSLFDLGGHSLTVTKISSRLRKRGFTVPLHIFFDHPTINGVVTAIGSP